MSKNIRNIIATILVLMSFSAIAPNCLNLTLAKVYAEDKPSLKNIYLSEGDNIEFSEDVYSYIVDVDKDDEEIFVKAKPYDTEDIVKVDGQVVTKENFYKENVKLEKGKNIIQIEVIDDKTKSKSTYTVYVYRGGKDAVYLEDININGKTIGFDKSTNLYNIELDEELNLQELEVIPDKGKYSITVNDIQLSEKNRIKLKFKSIAMYIIKIGIKDEDTGRIGTYTLNIYLGISVSPNVQGAISNALKPNQWFLEYGRWRHNDELGVTLKNTWFYDNEYKSYFRFNSRGNMQTGWIEDGGKDYYLNLIGAMQTGWLFYNEEWYFLGLDGAMKTGWVQYDDKWYCLRVDGGMSTGWIVSNDKWYYLDSSGAMQTGWIRSGRKWYYLNEDGHMETGWIKDNNQWYFLNSDGSMKCGEWLYYNNNWYYLTYAGNMKYDNINIKNSGWLSVEKDNKIYYFNEDGTMRTSPKTIDGYTYDFNQDGSIV